jgi:hypothetical protein
MTHHLTDEDLLLDFYGESAAADRTRIRRHLEECDECRALDRELRTVMMAVDTAPITEPPSGFEREMWARIEPLLPVGRPWRERWGTRMPNLAVAASIGLLLVAAFSAGRVWDRPSVPSPSPGVDASNAIDASTAVEASALSERLLRAEV